ncbi:thioesterase II family protein [Lentzea kentuckyensis]|uniref:thioesterase II family protein n=1 Tax=Lentzea kentuckyensis TaxID=360086 RepID=UPI000A36DCFF|nr:alpha/beta fold hydrolase [Lentzea kentuckyensis]
MTWYQRHGRGEGTELRLVCFPHAGGTPALFRGWPGHLPAGFELLTACYPGRHSRFGEPFAETMTELADAAADALTPFLDLPLAFFGHSMGSAVAYEVALRLAERHGIAPLRLFVSGRSAPHRTRRTSTYLADDATLLAETTALGSSANAALANPDLRELVLPVLRADFRLIETYHPENPAKVRSPIVACVGDEDADCAPESVRAWAELTTSRFELRNFPGDHFYLEDHEAELVRYLTGHLREDVRLHQITRRAAVGRA